MRKITQSNISQGNITQGEITQYDVTLGLIKWVNIRQNATKGCLMAKQRMFRATFYPPKKLFYTDNVRASVTNSMSAEA